MAQKNKPANVIPIGELKAKIWRNLSKDNRVWFNVEIVRLYKDDHDQTQEASQFGLTDLLAVAKVADMAFDWIHEQQVPARASESNE
ncbi:MAG: hypothetical protein SFV23_08125 [Planctomycetaceae bacterium]|nr:hypothetical protein [Planctomycetaceae bacterium]